MRKENADNISSRDGEFRTIRNRKEEVSFSISFWCLSDVCGYWEHCSKAVPLPIFACHSLVYSGISSHLSHVVPQTYLRSCFYYKLTCFGERLVESRVQRVVPKPSSDPAYQAAKAVGLWHLWRNSLLILSRQIISQITGQPIDYYEVEILPLTTQVYPGKGPAHLVGYDGLSPGPTFFIERGREIMVRFTNKATLNNSVHLHGSYSVITLDPLPWKA